MKEDLSKDEQAKDRYKTLSVPKHLTKKFDKHSFTEGR